MRIRIKKLAIGLGIPGIALGMALAASVPALADTVGSLCQASGNYCVGGNISSGSIMETKNPPGRTVTWHPTSGQWTDDHGNTWAIGNLKIGSLCMRRAFSGVAVDVQLGDCSDSGTAFWNDTGSHHRFGSKVDSQAFGHDRYLGSVNALNQDLFFCNEGDGGCFKVWTLF